MKHYYIEDIAVDPRREDRIKPVRSIQFDLFTNTIYINIDEPQGKKLVRASVQVPIEEIKNMYEWLIKKQVISIPIHSEGVGVTWSDERN